MVNRAGQDITLLATSPALIVRDELNPALASLLAHAVISNPKSPFDRTGDPVLFHRAGQFPTIDDPEYEVSRDIRLVYRSGELPFLLRVLAPLNERLHIPFSVTTFASAYGVQLTPDGRAVDEVRFGSHALDGLWPPPVPTTCIHSPDDPVVVPASSAAPAGGELVAVESGGHLDLLLSARVYRAVQVALEREARPAELPAPVTEASAEAG